MTPQEAHTVVRALLVVAIDAIKNDDNEQALRQLKIASELTFTYEAECMELTQENRQ